MKIERTNWFGLTAFNMRPFIASISIGANSTIYCCGLPPKLLSSSVARLFLCHCSSRGYNVSLLGMCSVVRGIGSIVSMLPLTTLLPSESLGFDCFMWV